MAVGCTKHEEINGVWPMGDASRQYAKKNKNVTCNQKGLRTRARNNLEVRYISQFGKQILPRINQGGPQRTEPIGRYEAAIRCLKLRNVSRKC